MDKPSRERLYSGNELAKLVGVAPTTIRNWTCKSERPLHAITAPSGRQIYSLSDLSLFIMENPDLRTARVVSERLATLTAEGTFAARHHQGNPSPTATPVTEEAETLRAALRDMRAAVDASVQGVVRSSELAEQTAAAHREVIAALQVTVRAYDAAMAMLDRSRTRHD